uniref:Uncharacterized protein n=1 Tax=Lepeophtheirus salmonis TaxID=72036 RepID=A0A0K2UAH9_LEPSM
MCITGFYQFFAFNERSHKITNEFEATTVSF